MTNTELIQKIKAEIERRIKECEATYPKDKDGYWFPEQEGAYAIAEEYKQLLSFLSTLESEKPMNPEELEEEMDRYFETMPVLEHENIFEDTFKNIARHFAQWGADHFRGITKKVETPVSDDLEEAAESHAKTKYGLTRLLGAEMKEVEDDFIAGAKWSFGQGWTFDAHKGAFGICFDGNIDNLLDGLKDKEEVTVQIRKK